ncbi:MAG: GNAT family N-acetyltransferase [Pleurocapsa sp.]
MTFDDLDNLVTIDRNPEVMRFINGGIATSSKAIAEEFLPYVMSYYDKSKSMGFWAIVEKQSKEFLGWIFLRPEADFELLQQLDLAEKDAVELGYRIRQQSWNRGYTTEVAKALIDKSFAETQANKINAWALIENKGSIRVMEKAGLKLQQEYVVTASMFKDDSLLAKPLIKNLLDRTLVKYQLKKAVSSPG